MKKLYTALAAFQQEVPAIYKSTSGYGYKYADLNEILEVINPLLQKHKLGFTQLLDGTRLKTVIFHTESSESIEGSVNIPQGVQLKGMNDFQVLGSAITYLRRYSLSAALGLVTDSDNDAYGEQNSGVKNTPKLEPITSPIDPVTEEQRQVVRDVGHEKGLTDSVIEARLRTIRTQKEYQDAMQNLLLLGRD